MQKEMGLLKQELQLNMEAEANPSPNRLKTPYESGTAESSEVNNNGNSISVLEANANEPVMSSVLIARI